MTIKILGLCGSIRVQSFNRKAMAAAGELMPAGMTLATEDIAEVPVFNGDVLEKGFPAPVARLRAAVSAADGLLFVTPEYNYSVSGVMKNAIDWISRAPDQPFNDKPIAIISASQGALGGVRAQYHLRQIMIFLNGQILNRPEVMIGAAAGKFDAQGKLTDEPTRKIIADQMLAFRDWVTRLTGKS